MCKKIVVITSINSPTKAVKAFCSFKDIEVIVVADVKTPDPWIWLEETDVTYLSIDSQDPDHYMELPINSYSRKMIGYLEAIRRGADIIIDTDDDNIPYLKWSLPEKESPLFVTNPGFVNIYKHFTDKLIWPRGLPFQFIDNDFNAFDTCLDGIKIGVWQGLADKDPDVDAVYRLMDQGATSFKVKRPIVLDIGTVSPFNSQNTSFVKELFPLLYLPVTVNQRFADILRGYVAQPIMWAAGYLLGVTNAGVYQERNQHDLVADFMDEIPCYMQSEIAFNAVNKVVKANNSITENLEVAYSYLRDIEIVTDQELIYLYNWLEALEKLNG